MSWKVFIENATNALKADKSGFSLKKQIAAYCTPFLLIFSTVLTSLNHDMFTTYLTGWLTYLGGLLGIGAYEKKIEQKDNVTPPTPPEP
jgi:pheromone shutdown protein TraB